MFTIIPPLLLVCILFCMSSTVGSSKKPSYLYDTPAVYTLATEIEPRIYSTMKRYVVSATRNSTVISCCMDNQKRSRTLHLMKEYIRDYEASSINIISVQGSHISPTDVVSNPFLVHKLINRVAKSLPRIIKRLKETKYNEEVEAFLKLQPNDTDIPFPTKSDDLENSLAALLRIQRYNNFETKDMAKGRLGTLDTGIRLSAHEAFDLGFAAKANSPEDLALSIEWLEIALEKLDKEEAGHSETFRDMGQKELEDAVTEHDEVCSNPTWNHRMETCFTSLINSGSYKNASSQIPQSREKAWITNQKKSAPDHRIFKTSSLPLRQNFISICAGNTLMSDEESSRLSCWYEGKKSAYLTIAPLKFEQLSAQPELFQIYDMLGPKTMEALKQYAISSGLERSLVANTRRNSDGKNYESDSRTSVQARLNETGNDTKLTHLLHSISRQVEYATGLNVVNIPGGRGGGNASEFLQVASYRTSHHYDLHKDAFNNIERAGESGDRIGTFMFYLSDVEVGGRTGFPMAGVSTKPVAGSAVFWYNLKKSGDVDYRTFHGGCPVAFGVKWVANKWILYNQNFDKRLCSLNPKE